MPFRKVLHVFINNRVYRSASTHYFQARNTLRSKADFCNSEQHLPAGFQHRKIASDVLQKQATVGVSCRPFCICGSGFVEALEKLHFQKCNISKLIRSFLMNLQYLRCENGNSDAAVILPRKCPAGTPGAKHPQFFSRIEVFR